MAQLSCYLCYFTLDGRLFCRWESVGSPHKLAWYWLQVLEKWTEEQVMLSEWSTTALCLPDSECHPHAVSSLFVLTNTTKIFVRWYPAQKGPFHREDNTVFWNLGENASEKPPTAWQDLILFTLHFRFLPTSGGSWSSCCCWRSWGQRASQRTLSRLRTADLWINKNKKAFCL